MQKVVEQGEKAMEKQVLFSTLHIILGLHLKQFRIGPFSVHQLLMGTVLRDPALFEYRDVIAKLALDSLWEI